MDRLFLDANVLFSAAWRADSGLLRLWRLDDVVLLASLYAIEEARRNLHEAEQHERLEDLLSLVQTVEDQLSVGQPALPLEVVLHEKDSPILSAAVMAKATHLLTGDLRHFGALFGRRVQGVLIQRPRDYLRR